MENLLFNNQFNRFQTTYGSDLNQACKNRIFMWVCFSPFRLQTKVIWVGHQFRFLLSEQNLKYDSVILFINHVKSWMVKKTIELRSDLTIRTCGCGLNPVCKHCVSCLFACFFHPFTLRISKRIRVWYKIGFLLLVWTNSEMLVHYLSWYPMWCIWQCSGSYNRMQSSPFNESFLSLSTVAFSASSFCCTSSDCCQNGKVIRAHAIFKRPSVGLCRCKIEGQVVISPN